MQNQTQKVNSLKQTEQIATKLAEQIQPGSLITLKGPLGAGKTAFAKAFARSLGINQTIKSPTFVIMRSYQLPNQTGQLNHLDLYRIKSPKKVNNLGLEEIFESKTDITIIEWPEIIENQINQNHLSIDIKITGDSSRIITITNI